VQVNAPNAESGQDAAHIMVGPPPAKPRQQLWPDGQLQPPPSVNVVTAPEDEPDEAPDEVPDEPPPLLLPFPPSSPLPPLFVVDPPHAAASPRPTETENQAVLFFMDEAPSPT
jgi:hypothetical protein